MALGPWETWSLVNMGLAFPPPWSISMEATAPWRRIASASGIRAGSTSGSVSSTASGWARPVPWTITSPMVTMQAPPLARSS